MTKTGRGQSPGIIIEIGQIAFDYTFTECCHLDLLLVAYERRFVRFLTSEVQAHSRYHMLQDPADSNLKVTNSTALFTKRDPGSRIQSEIGHGKWIILDVSVSNVVSVSSEISRHLSAILRKGSLVVWRQSCI